MATALDCVKPGNGLTEYDFSKVKTIELCNEISSQCRSKERGAQFSMLLWTVASVAMGYFAFLGAASFISTYGLLATGVTVFLAVTYLLPVTIVAGLIPIAAIALAMKSAGNANHYNKQAELADLHKASLVGRGIRPVQV